MSSFLNIFFVYRFRRRLLRAPQAFQRELLNPFLFPKELLLEVWDHGVLPDELHPSLIEVLPKEVAWTDRTVAILEEAVRLLDHVRDPKHVRSRPLQPTSEQAGDRTLIWEERHEVESPSQGRVDQSDRPVGGV